MKIKNNDLELYKDMFNYYNLITKIKDGYRLYFNKRKKNFVIVNINKNYEICHEFNKFSEFSISKLRFSSIENLSKIIDQIETKNKILEIKNMAQAKEKNKLCIN